MIELPDFSKKFEYENNFYQSCDAQRIGKILAHYELYKLTLNIPGDIIECGVFKGASLARFAMFRKLFEADRKKKIIGFDTFGEFPVTEFEGDIPMRDHFIESSGDSSIAADQLMKVLNYKSCGENIELIEGDITKTVPEYLEKNPDLKISLLNLDTDIYEPAVTILEHFYPKIQSGGILILDDYDVFPGETKAVNDFFKNKNVEIRRFDFTPTPCYLIKE